MSKIIRQRIQSTLADDPPRSKSLLVTVFGDSITPHGGAVMLKGLVKLLAPFAVNDRLVRTSVHRLQVDGWLVSRRQGRLSAYSLTSDGLRRFMNAYKRVYAPPEKFWDENWTLVYFPASASGRAERKNLCRDLEWEGFGTLAPGMFVHPKANPAVLQQIIGAARSTHSIFVLAGRSLEQLSTQPVQRFVRLCWDLDSLATGYMSFLSRFEPIRNVVEDFDHVAPQDAFALRTLIIHYLRRVALHDPLLPADLLPADWPGHRAYELCRDLYKRSYRKAEAFLHESLDTPDHRLPDEASYFHERFGGLD
jgi:phenylacetic acid degradation operon negative regulatory protein